MKKSFFKNTLFALFSLLVFASATAQPGGGWNNTTPEERAQKQTEQMTEKLSLSEEQAAMIAEINLKYAKKMKAWRDANPDADRETRGENMRLLRTEQDAELKTMLTEEQWTTWQKAVEEERAKRPGGKGRGEGKPPKTDGSTPQPQPEEKKNKGGGKR